MDKEFIIDKINAYIEKVRKEYRIEQVILFGSYAKGIADENSDIDIAIIMNDTGKDRLEVAQNLFRLRRDIDSRIEPVFIDNANHEDFFFKKIIEEGEIIFRLAD